MPPLRRTLAATVVALSLTVPLAGASAAAAPAAPGDDFSITQRTAPPTPPAGPDVTLPEQAVERAEAALSAAGADQHRPEATLALRDLFVALPRLTGEDRATAEGLLARPTDAEADGRVAYTVKTRQRCSKKLCVHWASSSPDAAGRAWVGKTLRTMKRVWRTEVGELGYRRPVKDARHGGRGGKLDVYLKDLGAQGLYGYCIPEYEYPDTRRREASGFCVLDNDFARSQYYARPLDSLQATAAHEFFHAVQFAYDYVEDRWLMEATATWMEERVYDGVNDNRQYLSAGQLVATYRPLDTYEQTESWQYGNWVFFEYLSQRFGTGVVKRIWKHLDGRNGRTYSIRGVKKALPRRTSLPKVYTQFAAANLTPGRSYAEGARWPGPDWADTGALGKGGVAEGPLTISHLAALDFRVRPKKELRRRSFKLRVTVDGPRRRTSPAAAVVVLRKSGKLQRHLVKLDRAGRGHRTVPFNRKQVKRVYVTVVNASTRYRCRTGSDTYSCHGEPRDDDKPFDLRLKVVKARS